MRARLSDGRETCPTRPVQFVVPPQKPRKRNSNAFEGKIYFLNPVHGLGASDTSSDSVPVARAAVKTVIMPNQSSGPMTKSPIYSYRKSSERSHLRKWLRPQRPPREMLDESSERWFGVPKGGSASASTARANDD